MEEEESEGVERSNSRYTITMEVNTFISTQPSLMRMETKCMTLTKSLFSSVYQRALYNNQIAPSWGLFSGESNDYGIGIEQRDVAWGWV